MKVSEQGVSRPYLCTDEEDRIRWCKGCHTGFRPGFSADEFESGHILRAYRDAMHEDERAEFSRKAAELVDGTFLEEAWGGMPEEWIDVGDDVLPLSSIRGILKEGCDAGAV